jgi:hypothetical protein
MRFRLDPSQSLAEAFRGLLETHSEAARAAAAAVAAERDPHRRRDLVRLARKTVKRLRAAAGLFEVAADAFPVDSSPLREASRLLSVPRDRHVRGITLARVAASIRRELPPQLADHLTRAMEAAAAAPAPAGPAAGGPPASPDPLADAEAIAAADASRRIAEWRHLLGSWPFTSLRWRRIRRQAHSRWRRLRRRLRRDLRSGDDERLHACRKSCGRLETMLLMLEGSGSPAIARRRRLIERIYEDLGDDRDLHLLAEWLRESSRGSVPSELAERLLEAILVRRQRLHRRLARRIGALPRLGRGKWSSLRRRTATRHPASGEIPPCDS